MLTGDIWFGIAAPVQQKFPEELRMKRYLSSLLFVCPVLVCGCAYAQDAAAKRGSSFSGADGNKKAGANR